MKIPAFSLLLVALSSTPLLSGHEGHSHNPATKEMSEAASTFLASLDEEQKKLTRFEFKNEERENWHYFPKDRAGIKLSDLKPHQTQLAFGVLGTGLTQRGLMTATQIMTLEQILRERGGDPDFRDPEKYHLSIFGDPKGKKPWGWRFEGHHLSLNFTLSDDHIVGTPLFLGTNPAEIKEGPFKGLRPLGEIEDLARAFTLELQTAQMKPVFTEQPPREIISGSQRVAKPLERQGVGSDEMDGELREKLFAIIDAVADLKRAEIAQEAMQKIDPKKRGNFHFAWGGSTKRGAPHYFRIQGADFLIEYANTQQGGNHAHMVWRDLKNDFGRDLLKEHFAKDHE